MKRSLLFVGMLLIAAIGFSQTKTTTEFICSAPSADRGIQSEWAMTTNFTATDINSVSHDLQIYLDAGKYVVVDVSCAWCSPCWSLHQSGVFEELDSIYGPTGTDELVVLWVEIESSNTLAQITGTVGTTGDSYADNTQGDWTNGGEFPIPIIDDASVNNSFSELYEGYVPTVYLVCPSGAAKVITDEAWDGAAAVYATISGCPTSGDAPEADFTGSLNAFLNSDITFTDASFSIDEITAWNWTFESGTPATATGESATAQWAAAGTYDVTLNVTNASGSNSVTKSVVIIDPSNVDDYHVTFEECIVGTTFATDFAPYNWTSLDNDGGSVYSDFSEWGLSGASTFAVYSHSLADYHVSATGDKCGICVSSAATNDDWFISPLLTLGSGSSLSLDVVTGLAQYPETYSIQVSTTDNLPASFTDISGAKVAPSSWTTETFDLSAYDNQSVYVAINYIGTDAFYFMIDNIDVNTLVSSELEGIPEFAVYPNPSNGIITISNAANANVKIVNNIGQVIFSKNNVSENEMIDLSEFGSGSYIMNVEQGNHSYNKHIILTK
jgi:PKD repeat protein